MYRLIANQGTRECGECRERRERRERMRLAGVVVLVLSLFSLGLTPVPIARSAAAPDATDTASGATMTMAHPAVPAAYADGTLVKGDRSPRVYVIYNGAAHWIVSRAVLDLLGFSGAPITTLPQRTMDRLPKGGNLAERILSSASNGLPNPYSPIVTVGGNLVTAPPSAPAGATVTIRGFGYAPHEQVQLNLADGALVAQVPADATGAFTTSIVIPASRAPATYRITGTGLSSTRFGIEPFTIVPATAHPTVAPSPSFTTQGGSFTVSGAGFQPGEILYLYDAGIYGVSSAAAATGAYGPVTLQVPTAVTVGPHSIWVYGTSSRLFVAGTIIVAPPLPASVQATPASTSVGGTVTVSGSGFVPGEGIALTVDNRPAGQVTADATGAFAGAVITVPQGVPAGQAAVTGHGALSGRAASAVITIVALTPRLLVSPSTATPGTTLNLAGTGFLAGEGVAIQFNGTALPTTPAAITADAQGNFFASATVPATALSGRNTVTATGARSGAVASSAVDVHLPIAATWYFAGLDTQNARSLVSVLNPDNTSAPVTVHIAFPNAAARNRTVTVAAHSRATIDVAGLAGRHTLLSLRLTSSHRIAAAQTTLRGGQDWSSTPGVSAPQRTWYLAAGYTGASFQEYLRLYNPHVFPLPVTIRLLPQHGRARMLRLAVGGDSSREILVNRHVGRNAGGVSAIVSAGGSIVVDRLSLFGRHGFGATEDTGTTATSATWYFIQGSTAGGLQTSYTILNPHRGNPAAVTATFYNGNGRRLGARTIIVAPQGRGVIAANGAVRGSDVAAVLTSNLPVVAERAIYYGRPTGRSRVGGGTAYGHSGGGLTWVFPEGNTGGGERETLLLLNTTGQSAAVSVNFYTTAGTATHVDLTIPARGHVALPVNGVPGLPAGEHSALITATNGVPFIAEQSIRSGDGRRGDTPMGTVF